MIPERLKLTHFLSHRETEIDFSGLHLVVLVGENGAGKSALLDAITWAVWDKSRASGETIITQGENTVSVEYTFRMPYQNGSERHFRILRRRTRSGKRMTHLLDFQEEINGTWHPIGEGGVRHTQKAIIRALQLEYDTFINSAYLRQGHADEFTSRSPADRKRLLAKILGLERWEHYRERVKERISAIKGKREQIEGQIAQKRAELEHRPTYEARLQEIEAKLDTALQRREELDELLSTLDRLEEQALTHRRSLQRLESEIEEEKRHLRDTEERMQAKRIQVAAHRQVLSREAEILARWRAYRAAQDEKQHWEEIARELRPYRQKIEAARRAIEAEAKRLRAEERRLREAIDAQRTALEAEARHLRREAHALEEQAYQHERTVEDARRQLESRRSALRTELEMLRQDESGDDRQQRMEKVEARLHELNELEAEKEKRERELQALVNEATRLEEQLRQLQEKVHALMEEKSLLAIAEARCPLCHQPLTDDHRGRILQEKEDEIAAAHRQVAEIRQRLEQLRKEEGQLQSQLRTDKWRLRSRLKLENEAVTLRQELKRQAENQRRIAELEPELQAVEAQLSDETFAIEARKTAEKSRAQAAAIYTRLEAGEFATEIRQTVKHLEAEAAAIRHRLETGEFAVEARDALKTLEAQMQALGYDETAHHKAYEQVKALADVEEAYQALNVARNTLQEAEENLRRLEAEKKEREERLARLQAEYKETRKRLDDLRPQLDRRHELEARRDAARDEVSRLRQELGALRQKLATLETLARQLIHLEEERTNLNERLGLLKELERAFSVKGIPAMIIEHILPQLEEEANAILTRLSGGRMHIRFETQRFTKEGKPVETLEIIISDEEGERPYENFSGGERFRIDFAVRIALSRLLANRAGVQLRSLFIDEGFGTLDSEGRSRLIEAVKAVQDDFDLILVVTHITEMQDAFPNRILVSRQEDRGSGVRLL